VFGKTSETFLQLTETAALAAAAAVVDLAECQSCYDLDTGSLVTHN